MAVNKVSQREIVEVPYQLPDFDQTSHGACAFNR